MGIGTTRIEHGNLLTPRQAINRTSRGDGETGDSRAPNDAALEPHWRDTGSIPTGAAGPNDPGTQAAARA